MSAVVSSNIRKIIRVGERSIGITIPKEWLNVLGLGIGSNVEVSLGSGYILIKPLTAAQHRIIHSVKIKHEDPDILSRLIIAGYIEGYDIIVLDEVRDIARKAFYPIAMRLPGVIAMDGVTFKIKVSVDEVNTDLNEVVSSMRSALNTMFDLLIDYFNTSDKNRLNEIIHLDDDLDRLHFLGMRTIKRTSFRDPPYSLDYAIVLKSLEHIGDSLDRVSNTLLHIDLNTLQSSPECRGVFKDIFAKVSSYVSKSVNAFTTSNVNLAMKVLLGREEISKSILSSIQKCIEVHGVLAMVHEAINAIYEAAEIAEVATARAVRAIGATHTEMSSAEREYREPSE
uniref:AbrB/MazE/SpoVT family DNA-binding domain-containing protein n=1 Tax=Ignisphaera aggregans TaxID=334771 RepID=A0A7J3QDL4_9CREN